LELPSRLEVLANLKATKPALKSFLEVCAIPSFSIAIANLVAIIRELKSF